MDRKCTALVGEALRLIAALSRSKDETEIRAAENRDDWRMRRNRVRSVDNAGRARAMTIRITASILVIFAAGGLIAPVKTSAQAGPFDGGRTAPLHSAFRAPMIRPTIAPLRPMRMGITTTLTYLRYPLLAGTMLSIACAAAMEHDVSLFFRRVRAGNDSRCAEGGRSPVLPKNHIRA
jgi:hypothetical protein